jgi:Na+/H+-dicarboxylate symporter
VITKSVGLKDLPSKLTGILPDNPLSSLVKGDMLQIVIFAIIIGIGLLILKPESAKPLSELFESIQQVSMAIVGIAMSFAPIAVFGLLAQSMMKTGPSVLLGLGVYAGSVVLAMLLLYVTYVIVVVLLARKSPLAFVSASREAALMGFSTNSSAATMPITVQSAEQNLGVSSSLAQFIVPLGATINMGGTACYQGLSTLFMAQLFGLDLSTSALTALTVTAVGASIGTPAVPGVGIIVLSGVLSSAGVPLAGLPLILGLDRILERFRTSLNVTGDLAACAVVQAKIGNQD